MHCNLFQFVSLLLSPYPAIVFLNILQTSKTVSLRTYISEPIIVLPETFNDETKVVLFNVVNPETFNAPKIVVVVVANVVNPETFNDDIKVVSFTNFAYI